MARVTRLGLYGGSRAVRAGSFAGKTAGVVSKAKHKFKGFIVNTGRMGR